MTRKPKSKRQCLLSYSPTTNQRTLITAFTAPAPIHEHPDMWGHSLLEIEVSTTFQVFFQNPNGLNLFTNNLPLLHDFKTCQEYGAGVICLPETNVNWNLTDQPTIFHSFLRRTWRHTTSSVSRSPKDFLSQFQPGGTATILCDSWTSRFVAKGEDPIGLGRWSFITLCGKGTKLVTLVTAYNATYTTGETTNFWQEQRTLTHLHVMHNQTVDAQPRRQFILDLQSWLENLIGAGHELIVCMDANDSYDPDNSVPSHPLHYVDGKPTIDRKHDGKLATLISTCRLMDPLVRPSLPLMLGAHKVLISS